MEFSFQEITFIFVQLKANFAQRNLVLTWHLQNNTIKFKNMLAFFLTLTYYSLSSTNPNEVSHFIWFLKSNNNLPFFLKNLRKTISSRMMISYQILRVVPSLVASLELLAHHRNVACLNLFYSYYFGNYSHYFFSIAIFFWNKKKLTVTFKIE